MSLDLTAFEALSFDCYGTLIDWEAGIAAVIGPWARRHDAALTDEELLVAYAENEAVVLRETPTILYPDALREAFRRTGEALDLPVSDDDADALGTSVPDWPAFDDSVEALTILQRHYELIILSNVDREGFAASNRRLVVDFDEILTAEDIGSYKPNPANFAALAARVADRGLSGRLLHVAQSLFHDHVPAQSSGLPGVWINRRHDRPGWGATPDPRETVTPDAEYSSLLAFAHAVEDACAARGDRPR
ncbi:HAD family hydrolase [Brevibacterium jeotgali]|uniref:Putative hydrolase of the HAD superfamily n=1 Tax=Brevibacterium jeotgali TaxID=1262550 RepID=A0A2H1L5U9_9MICO|nr:HAD family hydrolase [Brevibacterium jeotgali]TWB98927.1 putative hydrolase of the HAD superfamily [Brevibacterium jeotgali]SMY12242.1 putative hydrolase of the HAD superfamily [Brevibacterium jeotgali]